MPVVVVIVVVAIVDVVGRRRYALGPVGIGVGRRRGPVPRRVGRRRREALGRRVRRWRQVLLRVLRLRWLERLRRLLRATVEMMELAERVDRLHGGVPEGLHVRGRRGQRRPRLAR